MNDEYLNRLYGDMALIAKVPSDHKINFKTRTYSPRTGYFAALYRLYHGENKEDATKKVKHTASEATRALRAFPVDSLTVQLLIQKLRDLKMGIDRLINTYMQENHPVPETTGSFKDTIAYIDDTLDEFNKDAILRGSPGVLSAEKYQHYDPLSVVSNNSNHQNHKPKMGKSNE